MRAPAIFDRTTIYGAIILVGLILHGVQAHRFGFYWSDDVMYFSLGYQQAGCSAMKYILSDTAIALNSDRPVSYVAWALARAAYAINLPTLHWLLVLLVISNAVITAVLARRIFNEEWFAFAVGILFLTYPISPLEAIWGATIHYLVATLLATVVMLFSLNGLESSGKRRRNWFIISTMTFLALLLTHEAYALLPPAFICCYAVSRRHGFPENPDWIRFGSFWYRKPALFNLVQFIVVMFIYGLWRLFILPSYGVFSYPNSDVVLGIGRLVSKFATGLYILILPWAKALDGVFYPPPTIYIIISLCLGLITFLLNNWFMFKSNSRERIPRESEQRDHLLSRWMWIAFIGMILIVATDAVISISAIGIKHINGFPSRANYIALTGLALFLPATIWLLIRFSFRYKIFGCIFCLLGMSWYKFFRIDVTGKFPSISFTFPPLFHLHNITHTVLDFVCIGITIVLIAFLLISTTCRILRRKMPFQKDDTIYCETTKIFRNTLSGAIALIVLAGSLFQFSIKEGMIDRWNLTRRMYQQMKMDIPNIKDGTFVIFYTSDRGNREGAHYEISYFLQVLYNNPSLMGNLYGGVEYQADKIISQGFGRETAVEIPYDRLLFINYDDRAISPPQQKAIRIRGMGMRSVKSHVERIIKGNPVESPAWDHMMK